MKKLWVFIGIFAILFLALSDNAFSRSSENKAECERWCNANKPDCVFCDSNAFCRGRDHDVIHSFKKGTGNWYACGLSEYERESRKNKTDCENYCRSNPACVKCTADACGSGIKILKTFGGRGENWRACEKTNWARHSEEAHDAALKWCADYKKETKEDCRIVESGKSCPNGFYKSERIKVSWGRDYKVCLESKIATQRTKDCSGKAAANIEKALAWLDTNYNEILEDFQLQPKESRDRRARARSDRKFPRVTVTCEDPTKSMCSHARGYSRFIGSTIHLCYNKFKTFCGLVRTIMHEHAHNAWADREREQHKKGATSFDDTVHQIGQKAQKLCIDDGKDGNL